MNKIVIFFILFYIFGWLLLTYRITDVPPGINGDEAAIGYNAILVSKTGHDQSGKFLPLFVSVFNLTDWKQPITFYSTVLAFKIFGPSFSLLREISVIIVLISATFIFLLGKEILGIKAAFISLLIFMTIPAVLIQSHLALENIAPVPFITLWLLMMTKYKKTSNQKFLLFAGLALGISLYTYPGMRLIFPVLSLLTACLIFYINRKNSSQNFFLTLKFLTVVSIFPLFMILIKNQYPGAILAYNRPHVPTTYQELIMPYISSFDPSFLFLTGDTTSYHSTGKQGVFLLTTLPLFILGIIRIIQKKDLILSFILLTFFLSPILYGLVGTIHRGSRLLVLLPPYTIIASAGFISLVSIKNRLLKITILSVLVLLIIGNYADFTHDYWYEYPKRVKSDFAKPFHVVFEKLSHESRDKNLTPLIQDNLSQQNLIAFNFFEQVYFPNSLARWSESKSIPKKSILLIDNVETASKNSNFKLIKINESGFYLLVNQ